MCGIVGFTSKDNISDKILYKMMEKIKHRGPDSEGIYINKGTKFGHRRLIVIDPEGGIQPMISKKVMDFAIVYNGEIYNTDEIKKKLIELGHNFETESDTEIVLKSYIQWGNNCPKYLNGIFAFAIFDEAKEKIFLARDRFGVKPLFYHCDKKNFVFASEIKSLFEFPGISAKIDRDGLCELLAIGPARTFGNAIFTDIDELEPAHYLEYRRGILKKQSYFELTYAPHTENLNETAEHVYYLLNRAIKNQLTSDVTIGTFLSGGLDSSIISAIAAKEIKNLNTFSLSFKDNEKYFTKSIFQPDSDEKWAEKMHEFIGSNHHEIILDSLNAAYALEKAMEMRDFPGMADIDSSMLLFCEQIKKYVTVALSGECADEIFGGYPWYYRDDLKIDGFPWTRDISVRQSILKIDLDLENYSHKKYLAALKKAPAFPENNPDEKYKRDLFYLNITYFMGNLLERKDRMSMANGLEVRVPFCDHELIQYVYNIPWHMKFHDGREKGILRLAMKNVLPDEILWRKKSPYPKTFHPEYTKLVCRILEDELKASPLLDIIDKEKLFELAQTKKPWYGQLMSGPQLLGYFFQLCRWFRNYQIEF